MEKIGFAQKDVGSEVVKMELSAKEEIRLAVESVVNGNNPIRVLPTLSDFRYCFTCPVCGCHVSSRFVFGDRVVEVCRFCSGGLEV